MAAPEDQNAARPSFDLYIKRLQKLGAYQNSKGKVSFIEIPIYDEIEFGTPKTAAAIELNRLFSLKINNDSSWLGRRFWNRTFEAGKMAENLETDAQLIRQLLDEEKAESEGES